MKFHKSICLIVFSLLSVIISINCQEEEAIDPADGTKLKFPHYSYSRSGQNENRFKAQSNKCEFKTDCADLSSADKKNCIYSCISKKCYDEIYASDPLEEGEIDQRFNSFKGCYVDS